jgi:L-threonylcarbamoyladenylate synthase
VTVMAPRRIASSDISAIVRCLADGDVLLLPTDTVFGLCCDPTNQSAVDKLLDIKGRSAEVPMGLLIAGSVHAALCATSEHFDVDLFDDPSWPGDLTVVVSMHGQSSMAHGVGTAEGHPTIGLRRPRHGVVAKVVKDFGPIAATSANRHGMATLSTAAEILEQLDWSVDAYVEGVVEERAPSTVVATAPEGWSVLRPGSLPDSAVEALLGARRSAI